VKNLVKVFEKYDIQLTSLQEKQFDDYFKELVETNKFLNLTAITEEDEVVFKHFLDSVLPYKLFSQNEKIVDVGTGAGFPALPLKIVRPDLQVFMVDSLNKRINFLKNTIDKLSLNEIFAIHSRAEDFAKTNREKFDVAVARAVAPLNTLVEYLLPLVRVGGKIIVYKSIKLQEEIEMAQKAIQILGGKIKEVVKFTIAEEDLERNILIIDKIQKTPTQYPRTGNKPKLTPIK